MTFKIHDNKIRTLKPGDPRFNIVDQFVTAPRAGIFISEDCPRQYGEMIEFAVGNGWIQPVAHVHERELLFMGLSQE